LFNLKVSPVSGSFMVISFINHVVAGSLLIIIGVSHTKLSRQV
jgi:hypothetical protein